MLQSKVSLLLPSKLVLSSGLCSASMLATDSAVVELSGWECSSWLLVVLFKPLHGPWLNLSSDVCFLVSDWAFKLLQFQHGNLSVPSRSLVVDGS